MQNNRQNIIILLLLSLVWGSSFILMKRGLEVYSPTQLAALRLLLASLALLPFSLTAIRKCSLFQKKVIVLCGIIGSAIPAFLFAFAQTKIDSAVAGILNALTPLFTLMIGFLFFSVRHSGKQSAGILTGLAGALVLILADSGNNFSLNLIYSLMVILATLLYATNVNILKTYLQSVSPVQIAALSFLFLGPPAAVYLLFTDFMQLTLTHEKAFTAFGSVFILGVAGTAYSLIVFNKLLQNTNAVFATTVTYLIPIVAVGWGYYDGEALMLSDLFGMILILSGVYLTRNR
jgi:drug/metabolite transporter (DMT)-like permease